MKFPRSYELKSSMIELTDQQLSEYDGSDPTKPVYLGLL